MKKYYCSNGEYVYVEDFAANDKTIFVHYKGKKYIRNREILGKKLFPINPLATVSQTVEIGDIVLLKEFQKDETIKIKICDTHTEISYSRMGGAYYGNSVDLKEIGDFFGNIDGIEIISKVSPIGSAILGANTGDYVKVPLPDGSKRKYYIKQILKSAVR